MNLKHWLLKPSKVPTRAALFLVVISFLGFLDATYLTVEHYLGGTVPCTLGGCEVVLTSKYATLFDVPIALLGALFYATIFFLSLRLWEKGTSCLFNIIFVAVGLSFLLSLGLVYLQLFVLNSICFYCLGSALTSTILFAISLFVYIKNQG